MGEQLYACFSVFYLIHSSLVGCSYYFVDNGFTVLSAYENDDQITAIPLCKYDLRLVRYA